MDFKELMNGIIKDLAAKPMRIKLIVTRLNAKLDIDAMLMAFRDYVERSAQELDGSPVRSDSIKLICDCVRMLIGSQTFIGTKNCKFNLLPGQFQCCELLDTFLL